jgi:hypothetical protein
METARKVPFRATWRRRRGAHNAPNRMTPTALARRAFPRARAGPGNSGSYLEGDMMGSRTGWLDRK